MKKVGKEELYDFIGDLEEAYEEAERLGDDKLTQTLDILGLWNEGAPSKWLYRVWKAVRGDTLDQRETAWVFDRLSDEEQEPSEYDRPELAAYWYEKAAKVGDPVAQCNLANIYCCRLWNGKRAVYWREKAAAQKEPHAMRGLAYCLECGICCEGGADPQRAATLRREADEILRLEKETSK